MKRKAWDLRLTTRSQALAMAAMIAIANGCDHEMAAGVAGVEVEKLREWMRQPWWPRLAALAEAAVPTRERRAAMRLAAQGVVNRHLDDDSLEAAKIVSRDIGLFGEDETSHPLDEYDWTETTTQQLVDIALGRR